MKIINFIKEKILFVELGLVLVFALGMNPSNPEEGMYPLSDIPKQALIDAGLKIDPNDIYNPNGVSLIDALVRVGGCTGSFVSEYGLIITNHHCAFGAVSRASTTESNYLRDGFLAQTPEQEIPATGYTVRITESYEDVSEQVLAAAEGIEDLTERSKAISEKMREIGKAADDPENSIEGRVSEMFIGQTYVLFRYRIIRDVRLVYVPPRSIGEFGGETDNWIWPRHTGDFSFMRAYVAPDGSAAQYSEDNVPYQPKKFLRVNPQGVDENDFVFILGYPGRTYRHRPSQFLRYQYEYQLPYISKTYAWAIEQMERLSKDNEALKLKFASPMKGLANVEKNYRGKIQGIRRIQLIDKKQKEEAELMKFIDSDENLKQKFGGLFEEIEKTYQPLFKFGEFELWYNAFSRLSPSFGYLNFIVKNAQQKQLPNDERDSFYKEENLEKNVRSLKRYSRYSTKEMDRIMFAKMISDALAFKGDVRANAVEEAFGGKTDSELINAVYDAYDRLNLTDEDSFNALMEKSLDELETLNNPLIGMSASLAVQNKGIRQQTSAARAAMQKLIPQLAEVKKLYNKTTFIPDANSTLRLTYGHIKGYEPADAKYYKPITTLNGVIEKSYSGGEYAIPDALKVLYDNKDFGQFYSEKWGGIPVAILYDMDTTGGNSGSPILNAYGELIGVNFDRAFEATINDYAWNESYSRSIGVDIRYVLWVAQKLGGADNVLEELGVDL